MNIHFLHGFLGLPSDWDNFAKFFLPHMSIAHSIENFLSCPSPIIKNEKNILIGYSLGGRIALHSLALENHNWDGAIIISANPGLQNEKEKQDRIKSDAQWAHRFLTEPWETVMSAWNSQGVFSGQKNNILREEKFYNREKIADILNKFSLGKQDDFRDAIKGLKIPVLWIAGELDTKFVAIAKEMSSLNRNLKSEIVSNVGHRVPWEAEDKFVELCAEFIKGCIF